MILRRPYAFLIRHFRLIHLMITALLIYLAIKSRSVYLYLNTVLNETVLRYEALEYINYGIYIYILLAIILCYVIYALLKFKDKPRKLYLILIVGYILIAVFMLSVFSYMHDFGSAVPDGKTLRLYRDIFSISLLFQYFFIILMLMRGLGFDIKKFNFAKDAHELNASAEDSEEIEISTKIDMTNVARSINKQQREFGYFFQEFKAYIIVTLVLILAVSGYIIYSNYSKKNKVYNSGQVIGNIFNIVVTDSYYNTDGNDNYVIVSFDIAKYGKNALFNAGNMALVIGKEKYVPDKNICYRFSYLGDCYKKQYITSIYNSYIVTYKVDNLNINNAYAVYTDSYDRIYKVKLIMKET